MEPIGTESTSESNIHAMQIKAASAPNVLVVDESKPKLDVQTSAPSYLNSLRENDAPPFKKPEREARPHILIGTIMCEDDVIQMIAAHDVDGVVGLKRFLAKFLFEKKITEYNLSEKTFLISFLLETIDYAARRDFDAAKLACLLTLYISSHLYFKWYYWLAPQQLWAYFKDIMIRHTIEDSPDGQEVFEPEECYDIVTHFHTMYIANLPLIHLLTFGSYRLKFVWPFKTK